MTTTTHPSAALFEAHMQAELDGDIDLTMATMSPDPHINHVPVCAGGNGAPAVRDFYDRHLVGRFFPPDVQFDNVSRTVDDHQIVDEIVISFTHTRPIDFMLPGVPPTGKRVEAAFVVIVGVADGKVTHEHIYWDQASVLVQIGLLDPTGLPVTGAEQARLVLDPTLGYRTEY
jgi:carboxymethylenebutenolidase